MGSQPQAIGLKGQLQKIPRLQPKQLAQPSRNHQLPLGGEGEQSVHSITSNKRLTSVSRRSISQERLRLDAVAHR